MNQAHLLCLLSVELLTSYPVYLNGVMISIKNVCLRNQQQTDLLEGSLK